MGHAPAAFTADVYVTVLEEMAESAASAIAAFVPRKNKITPVVPAMCQQEEKMITDIKARDPAVLARSLVARGGSGI